MSRISDEIVEKAALAFWQPGGMAGWGRVGMQRALEAVWPADEPRFEWRLTYDPSDNAGSVIREPLGIVPEASVRALAEARTGAGYTDVKVWRRPVPEKWEQVE